MRLAAGGGGTMEKDAFDYEIEASSRPDPLNDEARAERMLLRVLAGVAVALAASGVVWLATAAFGG